VIREYLAEVLNLVESTSAFEVLAHIDYPARHWPDPATPYAPEAFEDEFRMVMRALARSGRVLEINPKVPLHADVVRWWHEAGGDAVSFGSDAHEPTTGAHGFTEAAAMAEFHGFHPGRDSHDFWRRHAPR
jgi:histidinol-phosphatase (PHP family)